MKTVQLSELERQALLKDREAFSVEYNGKLIGYYYPVVNQKDVERAAEEMDEIMEQVLAETGLTEEEFVTAFLSADEKSCA
jgi:hypothetical protein